ncbi:MAG: FxLYD domain-containing protein [Gaiellaceae bacterium]
MKSGIASRLSGIGSMFSGYGIQLQNVSPDEDALDVEVVVNILDASGLILKSESDTYAAIPAGATYYAGGEAISSSGTPSRLEVTVKVGARQKKSIPALPVVSNVRIVDTEYFGPEILGEIQNPYTKTLSSLARITFVCFDAGGNVIGGGYGYPETALPPGGRVAFDLRPEGGLTASQIASVQVSVEPELE